MTIKFLREVLKHYEDKEYDDWNIVFFDYNNQRSLIAFDGTYASSKESKSLTFPVMVPPVDGVTIDKRVDSLLKSMGYFNDKVKESSDKIKKSVRDFKTESEIASKKVIDKLNKFK